MKPTDNGHTKDNSSFIYAGGGGGTAPDAAPATEQISYITTCITKMKDTTPADFGVPSKYNKEAEYYANWRIANPVVPIPSTEPAPSVETPDNSKVICPACSHQFQAICVDDQSQRNALQRENEELRRSNNAHFICGQELTNELSELRKIGAEELPSLITDASVIDISFYYRLRASATAIIAKLKAKLPCGHSAEHDNTPDGCAVCAVQKDNVDQHNELVARGEIIAAQKSQIAELAAHIEAISRLSAAKDGT